MANDDYIIPGKYKLGDLFILQTGRYGDLNTIVIQIDPITNWPSELKVIDGYPDMGKHGFIEYNGEYFVKQWDFNTN